jgi:hypothetical protein
MKVGNLEEFHSPSGTASVTPSSIEKSTIPKNEEGEKRSKGVP